MANERLRALLLERRVSTAKLAEAVQVDAKTVERWIVAERILLGDPESPFVLERGQSEGIGDTMPAKARSAITMFRLIEAVPNVEIRLHGTILYNSIYRGDGQLFVNTHIYGAMANNAPFFHLRMIPGGAIATSYLESFERVWSQAEPLTEGK